MRCPPDASHDPKISNISHCVSGGWADITIEDQCFVSASDTVPQFYMKHTTTQTDIGTITVDRAYCIPP
jgi:hypothetical protein